MDRSNKLSSVAKLWTSFTVSLTANWYFFVLLNRTGYGLHRTTVGQDVVIMMWAVCGLAIILAAAISFDRSILSTRKAFVVCFALVPVVGFLTLILAGAVIGLDDAT